MAYDFMKLKSPIGDLVLVASEKALHALIYETAWSQWQGRFEDLQARETSLLLKAKQQLEQYFRKERIRFDLPLNPAGTQFQQRAWSALERIPYGGTSTYRRQAEDLGSPAACRAVGRANALNPISIIVPCHRVIASDGTLSGYAGGLPAKRFLLELEASAQTKSN